MGPVLINGQGTEALLIGRSSASMEGLNVLVGLVDADYQGEIYIMVQIVIPPLHIPQGSCIAQLIPLSQMSQGITPHASIQ